MSASNPAFIVGAWMTAGRYASRHETLGDDPERNLGSQSITPKITCWGFLGGTVWQLLRSCLARGSVDLHGCESSMLKAYA